MVRVKAVAVLLIERDGKPVTVQPGAELDLTSQEASDLAALSAVHVISFTADDATAAIATPAEDDPEMARPEVLVAPKKGR